MVITSYSHEDQRPSSSRIPNQRYTVETERRKYEPTLESESSTLPPGVEMGGIEPPSDGRTTGLLRVQLASVFLSPGVSREQGRRRAQSMKSPKSPTDTGSQQWLPG